jgi:sulfur relay (sulfurtransferase) DsrC/TusE family protein
MTETKEAQAVYVVSITNYFKPVCKILNHFYMVFSNPPTKEDILKELNKRKGEENEESRDLVQQISDFAEEMLSKNQVEAGWNSWHINKDNSEVERVECSRCLLV